MEEKPYQNENLKWSGLKQGYVISKYTVYFSLLIVVVKVSSLCPVFQGLASECCRFYNILISTETKQPPPDTSVFIGYPQPDEKKIAKKKKNVSQVLETKFVIFIISRSRSENAGLWGGAKRLFQQR